jgi:hypothetical protein
VIVATPCIVPGFAAWRDLGDEAGIEQRLDRAVQRSRAQAPVSIRLFGDTPHDFVAVKIGIGQRHQDLERRRGERIQSSFWHNDD